MRASHDAARGLRTALARRGRCARLGLAPVGPAGVPVAGLLLSEAAGRPASDRRAPDRPAYDDSDQAALLGGRPRPSATRLIALVELARGGDTEAFGQLYDHYHGSVYRFLYYRTRSAALAEDLTSETFFRALRSMSGFRWQGKDFGAWLMTIARNLCHRPLQGRPDPPRARPPRTWAPHDDATEGPENAVLAALTNEVLLDGAAPSCPTSSATA